MLGLNLIHVNKGATGVHSVTRTTFSHGEDIYWPSISDEFIHDDYASVNMWIMYYYYRIYELFYTYFQIKALKPGTTIAIKTLVSEEAFRIVT